MKERLNLGKKKEKERVNRTYPGGRVVTYVYRYRLQEQTKD